MRKAFQAFVEGFHELIMLAVTRRLDGNGLHDGEQILGAVVHLGCQQPVALLGLLALGDVGDHSE